MIPMGWMAPLCIATGNTMVIKAASFVPRSSMRIMELWAGGGASAGVLNLVTCSRSGSGDPPHAPRREGHLFRRLDLGGQAHLRDRRRARQAGAGADRGEEPRAGAAGRGAGAHGAGASSTPPAAARGRGAWRCPSPWWRRKIADQLVEALVKVMQELKIGPAYDKTSQLGPLVNADHRQSVVSWIEKGIEEGAELVLDGRDVTVPGYEKGFYLGPTLFDHVKRGMSVGDREIFGPVLCIKRVKSFEEGVELMNESEFGNGSVIYTQSGYYAREFARRSHAGMVGVNVGIPGAPGHVRLHRPQGVVLRGPSHHGHRRSAILHGAEERDRALVLGEGSARRPGQKQLGRDDLVLRSHRERKSEYCYHKSGPASDYMQGLRYEYRLRCWIVDSCFSMVFLSPPAP